MMAAHEPPGADAQPARRLRVRLDGPAELRRRAAWALEALLARARVLDWHLVEGSEADLVWGPGAETLPFDASTWEFAEDVEPDAARDPLAFTFWWLARVEELLAPAEAFDTHGRFRFAGSAMSRQQPLAAPVDELASQLAGQLGRWRSPKVAGADPTWRLVLTHDIDLPWRWTRSGRRRGLGLIRTHVRALRPVSALRATCALAASVVWRLLRNDPWSNAKRIERLERRLEATSTSYLLVGRHAPEDGDEELHTHVERYAGALSAGRAGVHGSYTASVEPGRIAEERRRVEQLIGSSATDHRFHYLRHRPVHAWPLLERAGLRSDSSLGFAEQPGFRAGTTHPFRAWDHEAGAPLQLVVIPLACMDASYDERYLGMPRAERGEHVQAVLDEIIRYDGAASLLVHNDRLCTVTDDGWTRQYRGLLRTVRRTGGSACSATEAAEAYRALLPDHSTPA